MFCTKGNLYNPHQYEICRLLHLHTAFTFQLLQEQDNSPRRMSLRAFLLFFCIPLSYTSLHQMPSKLGFHPPWQHCSQRKAHQSCQSSSHIIIHSEVAPSPHPPTPQQMSNFVTSVSASDTKWKIYSQSNSCHSC